jgi:hypothetical protein
MDLGERRVYQYSSNGLDLGIGRQNPCTRLNITAGPRHLSRDFNLNIEVLLIYEIKFE